jgi:6-pyruvoyltetrahydropterin/6-carboxytetrahydropterin synthase
MITISREYELQAAHRLPMTEPEHKCHRMHGHTWKVRVFLQGEICPIKAWIVDFAVLDKIWNLKVHSVLDHTCLNDVIPNPTTECIVMWLYNALAAPISLAGAKVVRIEVREGSSSRCDLDVERANA